MSESAHGALARSAMAAILRRAYKHWSDLRVLVSSASFALPFCLASALQAKDEPVRSPITIKLPPIFDSNASYAKVAKSSPPRETPSRTLAQAAIPNGGPSLPEQLGPPVAIAQRGLTFDQAISATLL